MKLEFTIKLIPAPRAGCMDRAGHCKNKSVPHERLFARFRAGMRFLRVSESGEGSGGMNKSPPTVNIESRILNMDRAKEIETLGS